MAIAELLSVSSFFQAGRSYSTFLQTKSRGRRGLKKEKKVKKYELYLLPYT